jgi:Tfp pilus assembly protein PilF
MRLTGSLAGVYLNLGVMRAQLGRFAEAVTFLQQAARLDPTLPRVQYSLGIAYFNAQQYQPAVEPLYNTRQTGDVLPVARAHDIVPIEHVSTHFLEWAPSRQDAPEGPE